MCQGRNLLAIEQDQLLVFNLARLFLYPIEGVVY